MKIDVDYSLYLCTDRGLMGLRWYPLSFLSRMWKPLRENYCDYGEIKTDKRRDF